MSQALQKEGWPPGAPTVVPRCVHGNANHSKSKARSSPPACRQPVFSSVIYEGVCSYNCASSWGEMRVRVCVLWRRWVRGNRVQFRPLLQGHGCREEGKTVAERKEGRKEGSSRALPSRWGTFAKGVNLDPVFFQTYRWVVTVDKWVPASFWIFSVPNKVGAFSRVGSWGVWSSCKAPCNKEYLSK